MNAVKIETRMDTFSFDRGHLNSKGIKSVIPHLQKELIQEGIIDAD